MRCWSAVASTGCLTSTASQESPYAVTEHDYSGSSIHVDVTKFANIPDGGGHKFVSRQQSRRNARETARRSGQRDNHYAPRIGTAFVHTVIDDHSRLAYAEICTDEKARHRHRCAAPSGGVVRRARGRRGAGLVRQRVGLPVLRLARGLRRTADHLQADRPYRPQTNGKIERFHRTLSDRCAYARLYASTEERDAALPGWLYFYNHHRAHSAIGGQPPVTHYVCCAAVGEM